MSQAGDDAPAPAAPQDPWEGSPELQAFAGRLVRARRHRGLGPRCERLRPRGEAIDRFAAAREYSTTLAARLDPRWACAPREELPDAVRRALQRCQKPFHLWNVERVEHGDGPAFERRDPLRVGAGAALPEELRVPRRVAKASRALREWIDEEGFRDAMLEMDRRRFQKLLREPLPFGRKDDDPADEGEVLVIGPPGPGGGPRGLPERIAPFVRRPRPTPDPRALRRLPEPDDDGVIHVPVPGPGGFDMSRPDDDDDRDRNDQGGGGVGGFDLSQPDD